MGPEKPACTIKLIQANQYVKSQVFFLTNLVVIHLSLDRKEQKEALKYAADTIFHDRVNKLRGTWSKHLEASFGSGAGTHSLKVRHKHTKAVLLTPPSWRPSTQGTFMNFIVTSRKYEEIKFFTRTSQNV